MFIKTYYVSCSICKNLMEVGKNTFYSKKPHYCIDCRIQHSNQYARGKRKLKKYCCAECNKSFAMAIERAENRFIKYNKYLCLSCSKKSERNPFFNCSFTEQQKKDFAQKRYNFYNDKNLGNIHRQQQSERFLGEKNPMYKGIDKRSNYYTRSKTLRLKVLERDKNICQCCQKYFESKDLQAHHKNGADKFIQDRLNINNCITLCKNCHKQFHRIYGYGNNMEEQFYHFLQNTSETNK